MPAGHTNTATINQRIPMSELQRNMLGRLQYGPISRDRAERSERSTLRSLSYRGYVAWQMGERGPNYWMITDAGRVAIASET